MKIEGSGSAPKCHRSGTLPPGRGQTLNLPPPGIEPRSPVSQACTLPTELSRQLILRVVGASKLTASEGSNPPPPNLPQPVEISITTQHNSMGSTKQYGPWILLIYIYIKLPIDL